MKLFQRKINKITHIQIEYKCQKKSMQEKGSIMVVECELKIPSLETTVTLVMEFLFPSSQPLKIIIFGFQDGKSSKDVPKGAEDEKKKSLEEIQRKKKERAERQKEKERKM